MPFPYCCRQRRVPTLEPSLHREESTVQRPAGMEAMESPPDPPAHAGLMIPHLSRHAGTRKTSSTGASQGIPPGGTQCMRARRQHELSAIRYRAAKTHAAPPLAGTHAGPCSHSGPEAGEVPSGSPAALVSENSEPQGARRPGGTSPLLRFLRSFVFSRRCARAECAAAD